MKIIEWKDLYHTDYDLRRLFAMNQRWENGRDFFMINRNRQTSALLYLKDSRAEYLLETGEKQSFPRGSILYIPQGSRYQTRFYACGSAQAHTQLIEFEMIDSSGAPFVCSHQITAVLPGGREADAFDEAVRIFRAFSFSYSEFKAVLYGLLSKIALQHQTQAIYSKTFFPIAPAIRHLQNNPCTDLSVAELAEMCHVSESCFRSLFKQYAGKTPSQYCLNNRMKKARQLLRSRLFSVSEVAAMVGYQDPGYFTRVFKKETGVLPGRYAQMPPEDFEK